MVDVSLRSLYFVGCHAINAALFVLLPVFYQKMAGFAFRILKCLATVTHKIPFIMLVKTISTDL